MPILKNQKHERFAQAIVSGMTQKEAAELVGFKPPRSSVRGCELRKLPQIAARITELTDQMTERTVGEPSLTRNWVIEQLKENVARAMQAVEIVTPQGKGTGEYRWDGSVANKALELLGKELGMFIERQERVNRRNWADYAEAELADLESQAVQAGVLPPEPETETVQ